MDPSSNEVQKGSFIQKLSGVIVDRRNLIFLIFAILIVFSVFSRNWVAVENDLAAYLPPDSETRLGLDRMASEFTTFGAAQVMIANISREEAEEVCSVIEGLDGVQSVGFDDSADHYNNVSALYDVTFDFDENDERCLDSLAAVKAALADYDLYVSTELGDTLSEIIADEMRVVIVIVAFIVVSVLLLTSQTYAEVPVLILTFLSAAILNMGSNFLLGKISFVSNSVTIVLQLALSVDYAIIFCNRYKEEHLTLPVREAVIAALSKAIPEICASSLTTIGGLAAMLFMQFKIGPDMGVCLMKSIVHSLISVFLLMPGLLMLFGPLMDKTRHKSFIPRIPFVGKFAYATRFVLPPVFLCLLVGAFLISQKCPFVYGYDGLETPKLNQEQITARMIEESFGATNMVALVVPAGDHDSEAALLAELERFDEVDHTVGLANSEAMDGYMLTDRLSPRQFSELTDLDFEVAELLYAAYAVNDENYGRIVSGLSSYSVPLIDMFMFLYDEVQDGYVTLDDELTETLESAYTLMSSARKQLEGENYSRMLVYLNLPEGGDTTYAFLDAIHETAELYYPGGDVCVVGNSTTDYDFQKSFSNDNLVVSIVTILIVLAVLLGTFKSVGMPLLLILVIQGSIWMNFSVPTLTGSGVFFMSYLVVSSIQMGANIDYAIVISSRYMELKNVMTRQEAIIETMNLSFPTIITSGTMMACAGILIGQMTSQAAIVGIGQALGRGTILSIVIVMFILPQILLLGDRIIEKTSFSVSSPIRQQSASGHITVDGIVRGEIHGKVSGFLRATVDGSVRLDVVTGHAEKEADDDEE